MSWSPAPHAHLKDKTCAWSLCCCCSHLVCPSKVSHYMSCSIKIINIYCSALSKYMTFKHTHSIYINYKIPVVKMWKKRGTWWALHLFKICHHWFSLHTLTYQHITTQYGGGLLPHQVQLGQYVKLTVVINIWQPGQHIPSFKLHLKLFICDTKKH